MIPIRVLVVDEEANRRRAVKDGLEENGGFEVYTAGSSSAGLLGLARLRPDVLVLNPHAGAAAGEPWRRALDRYRSARPLAVLVLRSRPDQAHLDDLADLGTVRLPVAPAEIFGPVVAWAGPECEETLGRAA